MKRDLIKALRGYGIRYAEKEGAGLVKLQHLKYSQLAFLLFKVEQGEKI